MGFFDSLAKGFLFLSNLIVFILAWAIFGLAIWVIVDKPSLMDILDQASFTVHTYTSTAILCLVVSIICIFIAFLGCCGAWKENKCMIATYFFFVLGLLILIIVAAAIGMAQGLEGLTKPLTDSLALYDDSSSRVDIKEIVAMWDQVQTDAHCCGVFNAGDWNKYNANYDGSSSRYTTASRPGYMEEEEFLPLVPKSCCASATDKERCQSAPTNKNGAYVEGCFTQVIDQISDHQNIIGGVAIGIIIMMALNLMISLYMCTCFSYENDPVPRPRKHAYGRPGNMGPA